MLATLLGISPVAAEQPEPRQEPAPMQLAESPQDRLAQNQTLHMTVGRSIIIRTEARLRRVLIANPDVVSTNTISPTELVVMAGTPGSTSLVLWLDNNETRILDVFVNVDVTLLREALERTFPNEAIRIEAEEGKILLTGTVTNKVVADEAGRVAAAFSKDVLNSLRIGPVARPKQVLLQVRFAEVNRSRLSQFGINILNAGAGNTIGTVTTQQFGGLGLGEDGLLRTQIGAPARGFTSEFRLTDLLNIFVFRPDINLGATIRLLQANNVLSILAEPNLMAVSGEPATFLAGGELPYPVVQGVGGLTNVSVQFRPFGVRLEFTGTVEDDGTVRLKVAPEVSAVDFTNAVTISGFVLPAISTRRAETVVHLRDGQSFGIAGLLDQRTTAQFSKVPGIGDIPILGQLFRSRNVNRADSELMVLVTPIIVDPVGDPPAAPEKPKSPVRPLQRENFDREIPGTERRR